MISVDDECLPTFMIIGAAKSGTTSLYHYLDQHPEIAMSSPKETNFFERADAAAFLYEYCGYFQPGFAARGEASVHYTLFPTVAGVPERIASVLPDLKLIYIVRDPVQRAVAHYHERYQSNAAPRSIARAFTDLDDPLKLWVWASRYALQVERYLEHFSRASLLILDTRDLRARRRETLASVFSFLGVNTTFDSPRFEEELNILHSGSKRLSAPGRALRYSGLANAVRRTMPAGVREPMFEVARRATSVPVRRRALSAEIERRLADALREDAERFREIAGLPFDHWSI